MTGIESYIIQVGIAAIFVYAWYDERKENKKQAAEFSVKYEKIITDQATSQQQMKVAVENNTKAMNSLVNKVDKLLNGQRKS